MDEVYRENQVPQIAQKLLDTLISESEASTIVGLSGDLGAGKTTLVKSLARELGINQSIISPTFVIAKFYETQNKRWSKLIHIDAYRIEKSEELETLGWNRLLNEKRALIVIEWPERVKDILPPEAKTFLIEHREDSRRIKSYE